MNDEKELIPVVCRKCGYESEREIGWLRPRAGLTDLLCVNCGVPANYTSEELERVALKRRSGGFDKLRIN